MSNDIVLDSENRKPKRTEGKRKRRAAEWKRHQAVLQIHLFVIGYRTVDIFRRRVIGKLR